jgi:hypothetical protein
LRLKVLLRSHDHLQNGHRHLHVFRQRKRAVDIDCARAVDSVSDVQFSESAVQKGVS